MKRSHSVKGCCSILCKWFAAATSTPMSKRTPRAVRRGDGTQHSKRSTCTVQASSKPLVLKNASPLPSSEVQVYVPRTCDGSSIELVRADRVTRQRDGIGKGEVRRWPRHTTQAVPRRCDCAASARKWAARTSKYAARTRAAMTMDSMHDAADEGWQYTVRTDVETRGRQESTISREVVKSPR